VGLPTGLPQDNCLDVQGCQDKKKQKIKKNKKKLKNLKDLLHKNTDKKQYDPALIALKVDQRIRRNVIIQDVQ
jgi:hypothetical protein